MPPKKKGLKKKLKKKEPKAEEEKKPEEQEPEYIDPIKALATVEIHVILATPPVDYLSKYLLRSLNSSFKMKLITINVNYKLIFLFVDFK